MQPKNFSGWVLEAETLDLMGRTDEAWETLLLVAHRFSNAPAISYLLACYCAKLGYPRAAERWIRAAAEIENSRSLKLRLLDEPDLSTVWELSESV